MPSKFVEIIPPFHRQGNGIPSAAMRWPDSGDWPSSGRPLPESPSVGPGTDRRQNHGAGAM